jgi:ribosome maturation factor RimP
MKMKVHEIRQKISEVAGPALEREGAFVVDVQLRLERKSVLVQLYVDTDKGITIDECAHISRELRSVFETQQTLQGTDFRLEVSSPGMDKPLRLLRQYPKNVGRRFHVRFSMGTDPASMKAVLTGVEGNQLTFQPDGGEPISLPFEQIIESQEELPW